MYLINPITANIKNATPNKKIQAAAMFKKNLIIFILFKY